MTRNDNAAARSPIGRLLLFAAAVLAGGCVHTESRAARAQVRTAGHPRGARVWIRLGQENRRYDKPRVTVDGGSVEELAVSPDRRTVALLWVNPEGTLLCAYPIYGAVRVAAGTWEEPRMVEYVFLEDRAVSVTMRRPKQVPCASVVDLTVQIDPALLPARVQGPSERFVRVDRARQTVTVALPRDTQGFLEEADTPFVVFTSDGRERVFRIGVDRDGGIAAVTGFVRNW